MHFSVSTHSADLELFTENGAVFKIAQNTFTIKWRRLPVAQGLDFWVDSLGIY